MLVSLILIILSFSWLFYETKCFSVRLPYGKDKPKLARYKVYHILKNRKPNGKDSIIHEGGNLPEGYSSNGEPVYNIILSPAIEPMCGYDWLNQHCADMVGFENKIEMNLANVRYKMTIKEPSILNDVMRVNRLTKQQKLALEV